MKTVDERKAYERERRRAWRAKNPERQKEYARDFYNRSADKRRYREQRPCADGKPDFMKCSCCGCTKLFNKDNFTENKQYIFKLSRKCRSCMLERHKITDAVRKYGISEFQITALRSNTKCFICKREKKLHIDHCHSTGKVRGMLCVGCNTGIGALMDDPEVMRSAIAYVELYK